MFPQRVLGLDAITFMLGAIAIYFCAKWLVIILNKAQNKWQAHLNVDQAVLFSVLFLGGMTIVDTCFTRYTRGTTSIWSLNRHAMCTPFAVTFIIYLCRDFWPKFQEGLFLIFILISSIFFTGVYQYATLPVLYFTFYSLYHSFL
jgi:cation transport ATPase